MGEYDALVISAAVTALFAFLGPVWELLANQSDLKRLDKLIDLQGKLVVSACNCSCRGKCKCNCQPDTLAKSLAQEIQAEFNRVEDRSSSHWTTRFIVGGLWFSGGLLAMVYTAVHFEWSSGWVGLFVVASSLALATAITAIFARSMRFNNPLKRQSKAVSA